MFSFFFGRELEYPREGYERFLVWKSGKFAPVFGRISLRMSTCSGSLMHMGKR